MHGFPQQPPTLTEDDFDAKYKPRNSPDGGIFWERDEILPLFEAGEITDNNVWTAVDADNDRTGAIADWHMGGFAFMVTENPWVDGRENMMFDESE